MEPTDAGSAALEDGRWEDARRAFESALAQGETPEVLDGLAEALWWLGDPRSSIRCRERAYAGFRRTGDVLGAASAALGLCLAYGANLGNRPAANGWLGRAERVLAGTDPNPLHGWLLLMMGWLAGDGGRARRFLEEALEFARSTSDPDLELMALSDLGTLLVSAGEVDTGMALIDESMAGSSAGESQRFDTFVFTICNLMGACSLVGDIERAAHWCTVADEFMTRIGCPFLFVSCRTKYGSLLVSKGRWVEAEQELTAALGMAQGVVPKLHSEAMARLADLRLRQGRVEEAEALLSGLDDEAGDLLVAQLHLVRGETGPASVLLERRLGQLADHDIEWARTLQMLVRAHLARGDLDAASRAASRLGTPGEIPRQASALAALCSAHLASARDQPDEAARLLERCLALYSSLDLPLETGRARLELARVLAAQQPEAAVAEARRALAVFDQLGAAMDADAAVSLLRELGVTARTGPRRAATLTKREEEVVRLVGLGLTNPEIAQRLYISRKTASHHVSNVLAKLGLRNRAEIVAYAARNFSPSPLP